MLKRILQQLVHRQGQGGRLLRGQVHIVAAHGDIDLHAGPAHSMRDAPRHPLQELAEVDQAESFDGEDLVHRGDAEHAVDRLGEDLAAGHLASVAELQP